MSTAPEQIDQRNKETRKTLSVLLKEGFMPIADDGFAPAPIMQKNHEFYFLIGEATEGEPVYRPTYRQT